MGIGRKTPVAVALEVVKAFPSSLMAAANAAGGEQVLVESTSDSGVQSWSLPSKPQHQRG